MRAMQAGPGRASNSLHARSVPGTSRFASALLCLLLSACGGGGANPNDNTASAPPPASGPSEADRIAAATRTAQSSTNACAAISPFYWELGDAAGARASGSVGGPTYNALSSMNIASASKWLYGAYVVQARGGALSATDIKYLTFRSGYVSFTSCLPGNTVGSCASRANNADYTAGEDGIFHYGGGHMQQHAVQMGLGPLANLALAQEIRRLLGVEIGLDYSQPQLAGGVVTTPGEYAKFLRKLLGGSLLMAASLGSNAVCTNPATCANASYSPMDSSENLHYSIGHWVEDDPTLGDGAFSSAGAFGFYPWINATKTLYGLVARQDNAGSGVESMYCGRLIRKAWSSASAQ